MFFSLFVALFVAISASPLVAEAPDVRSVVAADSELEFALKSLFIRELGYTLIGVKPVTIEGHPNCLEDDPELIKKVRSFLKTVFQGSTKFIFKTNEECDRFFHIELIHTAALRRLIRENKELQSFVMKKFGDVNALFSCLQNKSILKALDYDDFLLGLALGYGRDNAEYYCRRNAIGEYLRKYQADGCAPFLTAPGIVITGQLSAFYSLDIPSFDIPAPTPKKEFGSLEAEWEWIRRVEWDLRKQCKLKPPYFVRLPFYICRHGGDSESIREMYVKASGHLASLFCNRSAAAAIAKEAGSKR
jgi:hypothetical protein